MIVALVLSAVSIWTVQPHDNPKRNYNRLAGITYPAKLLTSNARRTINLGYGSGTIDDALSRIASLTSTGVTGPLATYQYAGSGRRVGKTMSNGKIVQTLWGSGAAGYERMDRFGRVKDLHTTKSVDETTIRRDQYGYDLAGNRLWDRVTQKDHSGVNHDNDRSWVYGYDPLHRLISAATGQLQTFEGNTYIYRGLGAPPWREANWNLDNLGNWSGDGTYPGLIKAMEENGILTDWENHVVNKANEIVARTTLLPPATQPDKMRQYIEFIRLVGSLAPVSNSKSDVKTK